MEKKIPIIRVYHGDAHDEKKMNLRYKIVQVSSLYGIPIHSCTELTFKFQCNFRMIVELTCMPFDKYDSRVCSTYIFIHNGAISRAK